ncbi:MAG: hypothetical protein H7A33_07730 [Deltaproteobacteria bacterium]|nr:hypothetical protein [Deltaproteobacteria bacterium]
MRKLNHITLFFILSLLVSCFGGSIEKRGSVKSYQNGVVQTIGGAFRVGKLSKAWVQKSIDYRAVLFEHQGDHSTIMVDSWCKGAFDDGALSDLARHLYRGIEGFKITSEEDFTLDNRAALHTQGQGRLDGVGVYFSSAVVKINGCVVDFVYLSVPERMPSHSDFMPFVQGFEFLKGPKVLE